MPVAGLTQAEANAAIEAALGLWGGRAGRGHAEGLPDHGHDRPLPAPYLGLACAGCDLPGPDGRGLRLVHRHLAGRSRRGKIDLLTVVAHELGHLFGLMDGNGTDLMASSLAPGGGFFPAPATCWPRTSRLAASPATTAEEAARSVASATPSPAGVILPSSGTAKGSLADEIAYLLVGDGMAPSTALNASADWRAAGQNILPIPVAEGSLEGLSQANANLAALAALDGIFAGGANGGRRSG